jgi:hypothetical protein
VIADRRLFLTLDRKRLVEEGDPRAAFLFVIKGGVYDEAEAKQLGWPSADTQPLQVEPEAKAMHEPPETKAQIIPPETRRMPRLLKRRKTNG